VLAGLGFLELYDPARFTINEDVLANLQTANFDRLAHEIASRRRAVLRTTSKRLMTTLRFRSRGRLLELFSSAGFIDVLGVLVGSWLSPASSTVI
jgi:hypothetical protein